MPHDTVMLTLLPCHGALMSRSHATVVLALLFNVNWSLMSWQWHCLTVISCNPIKTEKHQLVQCHFSIR